MSATRARPGCPPGRLPGLSGDRGRPAGKSLSSLPIAPLSPHLPSLRGQSPSPASASLGRRPARPAAAPVATTSTDHEPTTRHAAEPQSRATGVHGTTPARPGAAAAMPVAPHQGEGAGADHRFQPGPAAGASPRPASPPRSRSPCSSARPPAAPPTAQFLAQFRSQHFAVVDHRARARPRLPGLSRPPGQRAGRRPRPRQRRDASSSPMPAAASASPCSRPTRPRCPLA